MEALGLVLVMIGTSLASGTVAGLLGVGGGTVVVPILEYALCFTDVPPDLRMHVAVATSMATIVPTSIASAFAHDRHRAVDWALVRTWALPLLAGAVGAACFRHGVNRMCSPPSLRLYALSWQSK